MRKSHRKATSKSVSRLKTVTHIPSGKENKPFFGNTRPLFRKKPTKEVIPTTQETFIEMATQAFESVDLDKMGFITATKLKHCKKISAATKSQLEPVFGEVTQLGAVTFKHYLQLCQAHYAKISATNNAKVLEVRTVKPRPSNCKKTVKCRTERQQTVEAETQNLQSTRKHNTNNLKKQLAELQEVETHRGGEAMNQTLFTPGYQSSRIKAISCRLDRQIRENNKRLLTYVGYQGD